MKTRTVAFSVLAIAVLTVSFGYIYQLGFAHGSAHEQRHWLVSINGGAVTARENPAHPYLKGTIRVDQVHMVNVVETLSAP